MFRVLAYRSVTILHGSDSDEEIEKFNERFAEVIRARKHSINGVSTANCGIRVTHWPLPDKFIDVNSVMVIDDLFIHNTVFMKEADLLSRSEFKDYAEYIRKKRRKKDLGPTKYGFSVVYRHYEVDSDPVETHFVNGCDNKNDAETLFGLYLSLSLHNDEYINSMINDFRDKTPNNFSFDTEQEYHVGSDGPIIDGCDVEITHEPLTVVTRSQN